VCVCVCVCVCSCVRVLPTNLDLTLFVTHSRKTKSFENVEEGLDAAAASNKKRRTTPAEQESKPDGGPMMLGAKKGQESRHGAAVTAMDLETNEAEEVSTRHAVTLSAVKLEPEPELLAGPEPTTRAEEGTTLYPRALSTIN